jgi:hypothetical protein
MWRRRGRKPHRRWDRTLGSPSFGRLLNDGAILSGWPTPLRVIPVTSRTSNEQIGRFLPELPRRQDGRARPWREIRPVLNGILWILRAGAPWADLPARYPSHQTWPPAVSAVGPRRRVADRPRDPRAGPPRRRLSESARSVHRWQLRTRQARRHVRGQRRNAARGRRSWRSPIAPPLPADCVSLRMVTTLRVGTGSRRIDLGHLAVHLQRRRDASVSAR